MKVALLTTAKAPLQIKEVRTPTIASGKILVRLHYAALNHRDLWIQSIYAGPDTGVVAGSDGAGVIAAMAPDVTGFTVGQEVVINPSLGWGDDERAQLPDYRILGSPDDGTFAEYLLIEAANIFAKPAHLSLREAAAVPLAGLTAYRALFTRAQVQPGQKVLITGIGGGVSQFLLQYAVSIGAEVYVTSSKPEKIAQAVTKGAIAGFNYTDDNWPQQALAATRKGFDVIIDSAVGKGFEQLIAVAAMGGTIVLYGRTAGMLPEIEPRKIFWAQLNILGSTMGSPTEFGKMLQFYEKQQLIPEIDREYPLDQINDAFAQLASGTQTGKIVLKIE